jgi:hypothetical protein
MSLCKLSLPAVIFLTTISTAKADMTVSVDPGAAWIGYMNVFELPANGGAYLWGSGWGTADLNASFSGSILILTPNTSIDRDVPNDSYWWVGGADGAPNKNMDANLYVQDDALAGQTVTFTGNVLANTLVSPYTSTIFIKDFAPDYSSFVSTTLSAAPGVFSLSLLTGVGDHIQYGFETIGPDARLSTVASLGFVQATAVPEPSAFALLAGGMVVLLIRRRNM